MDNLENNDRLFIASHNKDTVEMVKNRCFEDEKLKKHIQFGQLKGFSDNIAQDLIKHDFKVFKYLPYGPTEVVMPYFVRRG